MDLYQQLLERVIVKSNRKIIYFCLFTISFFLIIAPVVQAATGGTLSQSQFFALACLGLVTFSLFIYLFVVIFQPEKF